MTRCKHCGRRSRLQVAADEATEQLMRKIGRSVKDTRERVRWTQQQAADKAGISRSEWSGLERGKRPATVATLNRVCHALGTRLEAYVSNATAADLPRDAVQLRAQELIIRTALGGAWRGLPEEQIDREARSSRYADVLLHRRPSHAPAAYAGTGVAPAAYAGTGVAPAEYALMEVIDWFADVGDPMRDWSRRLDALERYAISRMVGEEPVPRTSGCWIIRATQRNRRLLAEHRHLFRARFPGSGRAWLAALTNPATPMPEQPALLWVSVSGDRLFPARLG